MTTIAPVLEISDGTTVISLLDPLGICFSIDTIHSRAKGAGVWADSPIFEGRRLAYRQFGNVIDTFDLKARGVSQDDTIAILQELRRLLEKAVQYWTSGAQNSPVWIRAKAPKETNSRYAIIFDYRTPG
jgi:hypothetical protein